MISLEVWMIPLQLGAIMKENRDSPTSSSNNAASRFATSYGGINDADATSGGKRERVEKMEMIDCTEDECDRDSIKSNKSTKCDKYFAFCCAICLTLAECFGCFLQIACCCGIATCMV